MVYGRYSFFNYKGISDLNIDVNVFKLVSVGGGGLWRAWRVVV